MLVDSHCHLDFPELSAQLPLLLEAMHSQGIEWVLCPGVSLERLPDVLAVTQAHPHIYAAVGVHPDTLEGKEPSVEDLVALADHPRIIAIGETGLDYYRIEGDTEWQRARFRRHIHAAKETAKPLIVHTRAAGMDTLAILREERAERGVFHCFTEDMGVAEQALELGFFISFSGIVTFKNAAAIKEVARTIPLDRLLIETDAPYLAPVPHRGKLNQPAYLRHIAEEIARLRELSLEVLAQATTRNFFSLFFPEGVPE
jgi:TatD DNase family protein